uniref:Uncharacterized protein n=1 Tax=Anguilla anguilla TaxID=7936 RepID=A0A0E9UQT8_ANGAN
MCVPYQTYSKTGQKRKAPCTISHVLGAMFALFFCCEVLQDPNFLFTLMPLLLYAKLHSN